MGSTGDLVRIAKSGRRRITKKSLKAKYGTGKPVNLQWSEVDPSILAAYKDHKRDHPTRPLENEDIARITESPPPNYHELLEAVLATPAGWDGANDYHKRVEALLTAIYHPELVKPRREHRIHDNRKRIDITYTNAAQLGFFNWIAQHFPAPFVFVECKNYSRPIANEEFDQLSGRFSPSRGKVGLLVYRGYDDKEHTLDVCRDTARDQRGIVLPLDDNDLKALVEERTREPVREYMGLLHDRFRWLVS